MGAVRCLSADASDSPLADEASRKRELDALRRTVESLRNPAGAIRLAVQILVGPLRAALRGIEAGQASQVESVLGALEMATAELTHLLTPVANVPALEGAQLITMPPPGAEVEDIVAGVRRALAEQSVLEHHVAVQAVPGLRPKANAADIQAALVGLLGNAIEASARRRPADAPWQVELRVTLEPAEDLGEEMAVVFEVRDRGDGLPPGVLSWLEDPDVMTPAPEFEGPGMSLQLARRVAEGAGGQLCARRIGGTTRVRLSVPQE